MRSFFSYTGQMIDGGGRNFSQRLFRRSKREIRGENQGSNISSDLYPHAGLACPDKAVLEGSCLQLPARPTTHFHKSFSSSCWSSSNRVLGLLAFLPSPGADSPSGARWPVEAQIRVRVRVAFPIQRLSRSDARQGKRVRLLELKKLPRDPKEKAIAKIKQPTRRRAPKQ